MKTNIATFLLFIIASSNAFCGSFSSNTSNGTWSDPATWVFTGDADGIPDSDDDITILPGHQVNISGTNNSCRHIVVQGILNIPNLTLLKVFGNYIVSGQETGNNGAISFQGSGNFNLSGSGSFSTSIRYTFLYGNRTITSDVSLLKNSNCNTGNVTIRNQGYVRFSLIYGNNTTWINETGSTLELSSQNFTNWVVTLDATAPNNTIIYSNTSGSVTLLNTVNQSYHNLTLAGVSAVRRLPADIHVNGLFRVINGLLDTDGFDIYLRGNFQRVAPGAITQDPGTELIFDGTNSQTITNSGSAFAINHLIFNNPTTATFSSGLFTIRESIRVDQGSVNFGTNLVTLVSTPTSTAYIAPSNGTFTGSMIMQRHISSRVAGFSTMSSPSTGSTVQDWDNELLIVYATGGSSFPSVTGYSETLLDWEYVNSATTPLTPGKGFEVWLDDNGTYTSFTAATIDIRGTPNRGNISRAVTVDNDGWNLIGNPYAAHISFSDFRANAGVPMSDYFMYWDEAEDDYSFGGPGDEIAPHQGFWIEASSAGNVIFRETNKTSSNSSFFRSTQPGFFKLRLKSDGETNFTSNTNFVFEDGLSKVYEQGSDVTFKKAPHPNAPSLYSLSTEGKRLRLNKMEAENSLVLPLGFAVGVSGFYTISANELGLAQDAGFNCVVLEDKLTKTFTDLIEGSYRFYADGASDERFVLHLSKDNSACNRNLVSSASSELQGISITHTEQGIFVNYDLEDEMNSVISITNLLGQEIVSARSISISKGNIRVALPESFHGMFIVSVRQGDKMVTRKFFAP